MEVIRDASGVSADGSGTITLSDDSAIASPLLSMAVGGPTGLADSGTVVANVSLAGTDACLRTAIVLATSTAAATDAVASVEVEVNDCGVGGSVCLRSYDMFAAASTVFAEDCAALSSGDFAAATHTVLDWSASGFANLTVAALGVDLSVGLPADWFAWQRFTHVQVEVGDATSAADTTAVLTGVSVRNSAAVAVNCTGAWGYEHDGECLVAGLLEISSGAVTESRLNATCGNPSGGPDGQIVQAYTVQDFLAGANGGSLVCDGDAGLEHGDRRVENCTVSSNVCDNVVCGSVTTAEVRRIGCCWPPRSFDGLAGTQTKTHTHVHANSRRHASHPQSFHAFMNQSRHKPPAPPLAYRTVRSLARRPPTVRGSPVATRS